MSQKEDEDNVIEEFLKQYIQIDEDGNKFIPCPRFVGDYAAEHFRELEQEEAQLLGEIANMRFTG